MIVLGKRGEDLIKQWESFSYKAYLPTPNDVFTLAWGHVKGVKAGQTCTMQEAIEWFKEDTADAIRAVDLLSKKLGPGKLTQSMIDALISLVYNEGPTPIASNKAVGMPLIAGDYYGAWRGFDQYITQAHHPVLGLARRRAAEMTLFLADGIPHG